MKPQEVFELVEEELVGKTKEQVNAIKKCLRNICREQALAHRHAAETADNLALLTDMVSLPILVKVISATMRPTVAIKIPEVDDMMVRAQEKVDAIRQVKQKVGELNQSTRWCLHRTYRNITRSGSTHRTDEPPAIL